MFNEKGSLENSDLERPKIDNYETINDNGFDLNGDWWNKFYVNSSELHDFTVQMFELYLFYPKILLQMDPNFINQYEPGCISSVIEQKIYSAIRSV
ncbi:hypothetical protein AYI68_g4302 [Smittium mucronatum]|uniref:Uncharacterized protein n=1 Tax=Smittium mucronatum TaxID=133383 RepID=A0A1R0GXH3_9FUNG|nr:hypothetical protein AYI68_g4302 [Smittium mucronatum]